MEFNVLYEDEDLLVIDKPAGIVVFLEKQPSFEGKAKKTLIDFLLEKFPDLKNVGKPPRHGIVHRLDRDTSGILLVAKNEKALFFFQKQFKEKRVIKKYIALISGILKENQGKIETLIGRSLKNRKKQKIYLPFEPNSIDKRKAITEYKVLARFKNYTLVKAEPKTGRKHQIRAHFNYLGHPIVGDKIYSFKNQILPKGLKRQFLHAFGLKITLPDGREKEFKSDLPEDLKKVLERLDEKRK